MSKQELIREILNLPVDERIEISQILNQSINSSSKEIEDAWVEESMKRVEAYKNGTLETVAYEEVFGT